MSTTLKVRAVIRDDGQGQLYPHPTKPRQYVGWRDAYPGETAEHTLSPGPSFDSWIKPAPGRALVRLEYDVVPDNGDIRKALRDGCLVLHDGGAQ